MGQACQSACTTILAVEKYHGRKALTRPGRRLGVKKTPSGEVKSMIYDKWHKPPEDAKLVDYESFEELAGKYLRTQQVLKEIFGLLEKHQPPWYLRKH